MALLAVACLLAPRPHAGPGAFAAGQPLSSPEDAPLALFARGDAQPAVLPRVPAEAPVRVTLPRPPDDSATVPERAPVAARWLRGAQAPPARGGAPALGPGFASSRLPTGPPTPA